MPAEKKIHVVCPQCGKNGDVPVPIKLVAGKESGAISILIPVGLVCTHSFHVYIDKNFVVRDYLVSDLELQNQKDLYESKKQEILAKADEFNLEYENVLKFIAEKDIKLILMGGFYGTPLILLENAIDSERFRIIFAFFGKLFPSLVKSCTIMEPEKYLDFDKENAAKLSSYVVYNCVFKLSVRKPFNDSETESFNDILKILKAGKFKVQRVLAKNFIDYLLKFAEILQPLKNEKPDKIIKKLKKDFANQQNMITPEIISLIQKRNEFVLKNGKK